MSRLVLWLQRPIDGGILDKWFMWGLFWGVVVVVQLATFDVPGFALYCWTVPITCAAIYDEDNWHVMSVILSFGPWFLKESLPLWGF